MKPLQTMATKKTSGVASFINDNVYTKSFTPREYQVELLDLAREKDLIACLASRAAQNFLCLQLVHSFACHCDKPGLCICVLEDSQCAIQLVRDLRDFTSLAVQHATQEMSPDSDTQVVVTSSSLLLQWLEDRDVTESDIKLLIVDQCHKALQKDHPMAKMVAQLRHCGCSPRILGLTNSLLEGTRESCAARLEAQLLQLEGSIGCKAETASDILSVLRFYPKPHEFLIEAKSPEICCPLVVEILSQIHEAEEFLSNHVYDLRDVYGDFIEELEDIADPTSLPLAVLHDLKSVAISLGAWCADRAALVLLLRVEQLKVKTKYERHYLLLCMVSSVLIKIRAICDYEFEQHDESIRISKFATHKVLRLLEVLTQFRDRSLVSTDTKESTTETTKEPMEQTSVGNSSQQESATSPDAATVVDASDSVPNETRCVSDKPPAAVESAQVAVLAPAAATAEHRVSEEDAGENSGEPTQQAAAVPNGDQTSDCVECNLCAINKQSVKKNKKRKKLLSISSSKSDPTDENEGAEPVKVSSNEKTDEKIESISTEINNISLSEKVIDETSNAEKEDTDVNKNTENIRSLATSVVQKAPTRAEKRSYHRGSPRKLRRVPPQQLVAAQSGDSEPLCGMVFVARRFTAQVLFHLLNSARLLLPELAAITPQYTASLGEDGEVRDFEKEHRKQEEVLKRFRLRECNLLVCTPMLEEGVELPRCNLVIRFDPPGNFRSMVQSRGRARVNNAHFISLVEEKDTSQLVMAWARSLSMEKLLLSRCHNCEPSEEEEEFADAACLSVTPYCPSGLPGAASVALCGAMTLVNRYCAKLPSDTFTRLTPLWRYEQINSSKVRCCVRLPINSPLKREVEGPAASVRALARRLAALEVCKALYEARELDAELQPVGKESFLAQEQANLGLHEETEEEAGLAENGEEPDEVAVTLEHRPGTTKRRQYYYKKVADALMGCRPEPTQEAYLYHINLRLSCPLPEEQNTRGRKIYPPEESPRGFGILTLKPIPQICPFPIFTRSGEVCVSLEMSPQRVVLSSEQSEKVVAFLNYTFSSVLRLQKHLMIFGPESAENSYYIVPVTRKPEVLVDWDFVDLIWKQKDFVPSPVAEAERRNFTFDCAKYQDAVVMPWYRNQDQPQYFYVAEICTHLSPKSEFPGGEYHTFEEYYSAKYSLKVQCLTQPLLDVDHTSARLNFLTPRYVNRKGVALPVSSEHTKRNKRENLEQKQILVAELCALHPFPASLWRQAVSLPCILYRINGLLLADELRCKVALEIGLGMEVLPQIFRWSPLDFGWSLAEVLQRSRDQAVGGGDQPAAALPEGESKKTNSPTAELPDGEGEAGEKCAGGVEVSKSWLEIGTWSNDMASQGDDCDSLTEELPEELPCNVTLLSGDSLAEGPPGSDWGTGIPSPTRFRYGSPTAASSRKMGGFSAMDFGNSDSYSSFSDDDDMDDLSSDMSDDMAELTPAAAAEPPSQSIHPDGLRIEFKGAEAEAFDDQPAFVLPDDVIAEPKDSFAWDWEDLGEDWPAIKENYEKQVVANQLRIEGSKLLLRQDQAFVADRGVPGETSAEANMHRHPLKQSVQDNEAQLSLCQNGENSETLLVNGAVGSDNGCDEKNSSESNKSAEITCDIQASSNSQSNPVIPPSNPQSADVNQTSTAICTVTAFSFDTQPDLESHPGPSPSIILQGLTMSNANDGINLERLETIGDSFLKYAITTYLYCTHENIHEGKLSHLRSKQVSNLQLYRLGRDKQLGRSMIATKFEPHDNWLPPCYFVPWKLEKALIKAGVPPGMWNRQELASLRLKDNDTIDKLVWERKNELLSVPAASQENSEHLLPFVPYNLLTQHSIPDKSLADCVEALIGAYLIACGPRGALLFMSWLGIRVLPASSTPVRDNRGKYGWLEAPPSPLLRHVPDPEGELERMLRGFEQFEERLKYRFRDRAYLLQAMSHASFSPNRLTDCYQRLEFLGDAVLDYLITRYLYEDKRQHSPGALTDLRSALVNNAIFAVLAVRHGFHQFFLHLSPGLAQVIQRFVRLQQANSHCLAPQYYVLGDGDCSEAEDIEVPKALGDVFESVAGAIFLDSGMSLDAVWRTYHAMMAPELELFSAHVPKSPIRELLEREPETAKFGKPEKLADGRRVRVSVEVFGQGVFRGIGRNYRIAKSTAAKCALRHLSLRRSTTDARNSRFY